MSTVGKHSEPISDFTPLSFGGCVLWLDATSSNNFALTGSNVTAWYDNSSFSNHANRPLNGNPVLSNGAINGRPAVFFANGPSIDGSMNLTAAGVTGFMVVRPMQSGVGRGDQRVFSAVTAGAADWNDNGRFLVGIQGNTTEYRFNRGNTYIARTNFNVATNHIVSWTYDGASNYMYLNGADADLAQGVALSNTAFNVTMYGLGNQATPTTETYNGFIGEVIIYNDFLQPSQRRAVEGYLAWKWGIAPSLGTTFSPLTSLSNCAVWLDGADATTLTLSGTSNITQWRDKAGSNVMTNIGTPVYTSNAVNGVPGVQFDVNAGFQVSPMSNAANRTTLSVYGVVTSGSTAQGNARIFTVGRISDGTTNNDFNSSHLWTLFRGGDATFWFQHAGSSVNAGTSVLGVGKPCLISLIFNGSTATLYTNGSNAGSINTTNTLNFDRFGIAKNINPNAGSQYDAFAGTVGEFLMFYDGHTDAQRLQVESYLASKWNVSMRAPLHLVPTHSHTTRRPFLRDFAPTDIPGCAFWLDAADRSTLTLSASNTVTGWKDKSKDKRAVTVVTEPSYSSNGFNGAPTIQFTSGQYLSSSTATTFSNGYTIFQVAQTTGSGYQISLMVGGNTNPFVFWWRGDFNSYTANQEGIGGQGNDRYTTINVPMLHSCVVSPSTPYWSYYTNGIRQVNPNLGGVNTAPLADLGGSNVYVPGTLVQFGGPAGGGLTGNISEVILFSNVLKTSERLQVESYLATKWGLRTSFSSVVPHPYRYGTWAGPPTSISGCRMWLDAADTTTLTLSGSVVTQWRDKTSNGYIATGVNSPTYNATSNGVAFVQSSNQYMTLPDGCLPSGDSAYSYLVVLTPIITGINMDIITAGNSTTNQKFALRTDGGNGSLRTYWFGVDQQTSNALVSGARGVGAAYYSPGGTRSTWVNFTRGVADTPAARAQGTGGNMIGRLNIAPNGYSMNGQIHELLVFDVSLTTPQRQQVEGYLAWKWGLQSTLAGPAGNWVALYRPLTAEFDPRSIGSCVAWFDAADGATFQFASGSNLSAWLDKSGFQNHLATNTSNAGNWPTLTPNALNGRPVITFNGASGMQGPYAPTSSTQPQTMFVVARPAVVTGANRVVVQCPTIYQTPGSPNYAMSLITAGFSSDRWMHSGFYGDTNGVSNGLISSTTRTDIVAGSWRPSRSTLAVNGTEYGESSATPTALATKAANNSKMVIGGGWYFPDNYYRDFFNGYIAEVLIFSSFLTAADRQRIEGYLAWKWGLQSNLPALHPYVSTNF